MTQWSAAILLHPHSSNLAMLSRTVPESSLSELSESSSFSTVASGEPFGPLPFRALDESEYTKKYTKKKQA